MDGAFSGAFAGNSLGIKESHSNAQQDAQQMFNEVNASAEKMIANPDGVNVS